MSRSKLHLFNPENDLALGLGCRHYTPPPHAAQLHRAGALLPAWWAGDSDGIIAPYAEAAADAEWLGSRWGIACNIGVPSGVYEAVPWGWSEDARRQFVIAGADRSMLPADDVLARLRMLSHRRSSIALLRALGREELAAEEVTSPQRALELEAAEGGRFFKSPWSCSGRGVFCAAGLPQKVLADKAAGIIHRQGSVMVERGWRKIEEFGALFESTATGVRFGGLSMFVTEPRGAYTGNIVAPQDYFAGRIDRLGLLGELTDTVSRLEGVLGSMIGDDYRGWLGVDMMAYASANGAAALHPCIELNLRMTMGVVAMKIAARLHATSPRLMSWQRCDSPVDGATLLLLPPRCGFALTLG